MNTIYLAWEDRRSHQWFPVGRLVRDSSEMGRYEFVYTQGALQAKEYSGFFEIPGFPNLDRQYRADELFPAFLNRTMNLNRPDRAGYLSELGLDEAEWDALSELCVSGGLSHADSFEVFPEIEPDREGGFETRFVLHGLRHLNKHAIERSESLRVGYTLRLSFELNNPATSHAILVMTDDYYSLGWLPRYLVDCMHRGWRLAGRRGGRICGQGQPLRAVEQPPAGGLQGKTAQGIQPDEGLGAVQTNRPYGFWS